MPASTTSPEPSSPAGQMEELRRQFQACSAAASELIESLSEAELKQRSKNQGWSVAECIQHLTATNKLYLPILDASLQQAPAGSGPYKMDWRGRLLKWVLEPPYRSKVKTMPSLEPKIEDIRCVLPDFIVSQQQFLEAMEQWRGRAPSLPEIAAG